MRGSFSAFILLAVSIFAGHVVVQAQQGGEDSMHTDRMAVSSSWDNLPSAPEPADGQDRRKDVPWMGVVHYGRFSRWAIGGDISPLGIGIKSGTILTETIDVRLQGNIFIFNGNYKSIDQFDEIDGSLHLNGLQSMVDFYPKNSIFRISGGLQLWNGNDVSVTGSVKGGTSFDISSCPQGGDSCSKDQYTPVRYWSSTADPLVASADLNLHPRQPGFLVTGGFGRFIPRSERHWSFPVEIGVLFMGHPTIKLGAAGSVCTDAAQTNCTAVDGASQLALQFQDDLIATQTKIQHNALDHVSIWPIFSYGFMYSFSRPNK